MDVDTSSDSSSSQPTSPASNNAKPTRSSPTIHRSINSDPEKIATLAEKLYASLQTFKSSKTRTNVSIPLSEFDDIVARSQQLALLTFGHAVSHRSTDDTLCLRISEMSDRISNQLANVEAQLKTISPHVPNAATNPAQSLPHAPSLTGTRHDTLYLEDGNLIIAAPISTGKTMLFRVHQSMLSLQSPVFAAMFTLPHPAANRDLYDGAPFVHMPDDAESIESLLKVLYNHSALPYKRLDPLTPLNVGPTLAMATKYEMDSLRNRIVTQLEADWPGSLPGWDRLETEVAGFTKEHTSEPNLKVDDLYLDERLPEPCAAIRLAMDMNIPKILPSAMYHLSRLSAIHDDWLETRKDDRAGLGLNRTARWDLLEVSDFKLLVKLRETISAVHFRSLYKAPAKSCRTPESCAEMWNKACCQWERTDDHLEEMRKLANARPTQGLCRLCWSEARSSFSEKRVELWDDICECIEEHTRGQ